MTYHEYKTKYSLTLDEAQDKACAETEGHILLLAVPGSGKTTVMVARLGYLVFGKGVAPSQILAVTYSVAGAREMSRRYEKTFGSSDIEIRTIHGFCAAIIRRYERYKGTTAFRLLDRESEVSQIIRMILTEHGGYPTENEIKDVKTNIAYCRNMLLTDAEITDQIKLDNRDFPGIYKKYKEFKTENRLMDYDDQLCFAYKIMCAYPAVNEMYAGKFRYICVDEAQDTSKIQHMIIRKAAEKCGNLFMVGDEDQSIYGFRAAYPEALLEFDTLYPDARVLFAENNYRSTKKIVESADRFIRKNTGRREKHMVTGNDTGAAIRRTELSDLRLLPEYILKTAKEQKPGEQTAVLCRLNDSALPFIDILEENGIPYVFRGNDGLFFTHYIVNDIKNLLLFAADPFDKQIFEQIYYKFSCGVSRTDFEYIVTHNNGKNMLSYPDYMADSPYFSDVKRKRLKKVRDGFAKAAVSDSYTALHLIMNSVGYSSYLSRRTQDMTKINTLYAIAQRRRRVPDFFSRLDTLAEIVKRGSENGGGLVLSTIHSAKGMEFDHVIIADARNGILPSLYEPADGKKYTVEEIQTTEEDRRLFYVAVTRAKKTLNVITCAREFGEISEGADFVSQLFGEAKPAAEKKALPKNRAVMSPEQFKKLLDSFSPGVYVSHKTFGSGVILARKGSFAEVKFSRLALPKRIDLSVCIEKRLITAE